MSNAGSVRRFLATITLALSAPACGHTPSAAPATPAALAPEAAAGSSLAAGGAGASTPSASASDPGCVPARSLDPGPIADEVTCLLRKYIEIDTTNPPGNELAAAKFLAAVLERDGIPSQIIESEPGRANLIARRKGQGGHGGAVMLVHHMDVVPASADEWSVPPLSGTLRDGFLWGRGSIDNKGAGVAQVVMLLLLERLHIPLQRDVVLLAVADEESGGGAGARYLTEKRPELFSDVDFVLNEGGAIFAPPDGPPAYSVELAQKAPLWLRVTARGTSGHGSAPSPDNASKVLVRALARLVAHDFPLQVVPEVQAVFTTRAAGLPEPRHSQYLHLAASLKAPAFREQFLKDPRDAALVQNTLALTMLSASAKENVISERASAVLDMRLLPGEDPAAVTREVTRVLAEPSLTVEPFLSWQAHRSPRDTPLFAAIEQLAKERHPGALVNANVIASFTDCNAFRAHGKVCYGFFPMQVTRETLGGVHGKDERVNVQALSQAVLDLKLLLEKL